VDHTELVATSAVSRAATTAKIRGRTLDAATLGGVFGIEIDDSAGPTPVSASSAPPKTVAAKAAPHNAKTCVTLAELAAVGVTMGELAELTAVGTIIPTRDDGVYRTTPAARATLMSRRARPGIGNIRSGDGRP